MSIEKVLSKYYKQILLLSLIALLLFSRYYMLGKDITNFDAFYFKNWSYVFMQEFESGNFDNLIVTIQPGAFTVYSNIIGFKLLHLFNDKLGLITAEGHGFELLMHTYQKLFQSTLIILLIILTTYQLAKLSTKRIALFYMLISIFEPIFIAHSRVIQTDMLQALLMFTSVLFVIQFTNNSKDKKHLILSGIFAGFAFIQKAPSILLLGIIPGIMLINLFISKDISKGSIKRYILNCLLFLITMVTISFLFFPPFWGNPIITLKRITWDAFLFGVSGINTEDYTYSQYTNSSKLSMAYLNYLLYRTSTIFLLGFGLMAFLSIKKWKYARYKKLLLFLLFYMVTYFLMLQISEKKFQRYFIILLVPLSVYSAYGYNLLSLVYKRANYLLISIALIIIGLFNYVYWAPDFMGYTNVFNQLIQNEKVVYEGGTGFYRLGQHLEIEYGLDKEIAIADPTSLKLFYDGNIKDITDSTFNEDILIYTINQDRDEALPGYTLREKFGIKNQPYFLIYTRNN